MQAKVSTAVNRLSLEFFVFCPNLTPLYSIMNIIYAWVGFFQESHETPSPQVLKSII